MRNHESGGSVADDALLALFHEDPHSAWGVFLDRFSEPVYAHIQRLGWEGDEAAERFLDVCGKLSADGFRRMRSIRRTAKPGNLAPWLLTVVERVCVRWIWSAEGRAKSFAEIDALPPFERRVFELRFRHGLTPGAIVEQIEEESGEAVGLTRVWTALETILDALDLARVGRLLHNLARSRGTLFVDGTSPNGGPAFVFEEEEPEPAEETPLIRREESGAARGLLSRLTVRDRLLVLLRYEDALERGPIAALLRIDEDEVRSRLASAIVTLRPDSPSEARTAPGREARDDAGDA